jgi:hypothetical protein
MSDSSENVNKTKRKMERKIISFVGRVIEKKEEKEYTLDEKYYCLTIKTEEEKREIMVFRRKVDKKI